MWIRGRGVRNKIVDREEVIGGVNIGVIIGVISVDRAVINSIVDQDIITAIKGLTIKKIWFLLN